MSLCLHNESTNDDARSGSSAVVEASVRAYGHQHDGVRLPHRDSYAVAAPGPYRGPSRESREQAEELTLAVGATRARGAGNRARPEEADPQRTCFERDLDRIKYSTAFRRLAGKCQVFVAPDDIHLRTRMTHAIEVAQVGLSVARAVGLNTALVEATALAHDCGHGPGGHASEDAFEPFVAGGYDHAIWGADVTLAPLNLCAETLDGVRHHSWRLSAGSSPESELISLADRMSYCTHDFDDALRAGIVTADDLPASVRELLGTKQSEQIRALVGATIGTIEGTGRIGLPQDIADALDEYRMFNYERIYLTPASEHQHELIIAMLRALVEHYTRLPHLIPAVAGGEIVVDDDASALMTSVSYVSGMTDRFAIAQARDLLAWNDDQLPIGL